MPQFTSDWHSHAIPTWEQYFSLLNWSHETPLTVVEIGSFEGRSTLWLLDNLLGHPESRIYCTDLFDLHPTQPAEEKRALRERFDTNIAESGHAAKVELFHQPSNTTLLELLHRGVRADLIYVDGSHAAPDVLEDLVLGFRLAKVGALIICDDYLWSCEPTGQQDLINSPKLAIDAFVNCNIRRIQIPKGQPLYQFAFQKIGE
jgi:predicted O-methyltransferase YrrM